MKNAEVAPDFPTSYTARQSLHRITKACHVVRPATDFKLSLLLRTIVYGLKLL
jgi:hypothetical protein